MTKYKTSGNSKIYCRDSIDSLPKTPSRSLRYWRAQAKKIFAEYPSINVVECVVDGCKTSSQVVGERGDYTPGKGVYVIIASKGGKWGKSRREYRNDADKSKTTLLWQAKQERKRAEDYKACLLLADELRPILGPEGEGRKWLVRGPHEVEVSFVDGQGDFSDALISRLEAAQPDRWKSQTLGLHSEILTCDQ